MSTTLNTAVRPSFATIVDTFQEAKTMFKGSGASLRLSGESLHTKSSKPSGWGSKAAIQRREKRKAATELVTKSLNEHLEKAGLGKNAGSNLIFNLRLNNKISIDRITVKDLKTLSREADETIKRTRDAKTQVFDSLESKQNLILAVNKSRNEREDFQNTGLNGLVQGTQWEMSDHGSGGAILVTGDNNVQSVLKFDGNNIENGEKSYKLLNALRTATAEPLPFVVPNMTVVSLAPNTELRNEVDLKLGQEINGLKIKIQTAKNENVSEVEIKRLELKLERLEGKGKNPGIQDKLKSSPNVIKMEMIKNSKQMNLLDLQTKHALLHSDQFGQNVGKSMVILQFLGFNDHFHAGSWGSTNFTNLMVNSEGHIHLIDPSMNQEGNQVGLKTSILMTKMLDMLSLVSRCDSKEEAQTAIGKAFAFHEGAYAGENNDGEGAPLGNLIANVFGSKLSAGGTLFVKERGNGEGVRDEREYLETIGPPTQLLFVANVVKGLLEGIRYLDRNRTNITNQIEDTKIGNEKIANYDSRVVLDEINVKLTNMGQEKLRNIETALNEYITDLKKMI